MEWLVNSNWLPMVWFFICVDFFFNIGPSLIGLQAFYAQPSQCLNLFGELLICYHKLISYSPQFLQVSLPEKREIMSVKSHSVLVAILNTKNSVVRNAFFGLRDSMAGGNHPIPGFYPIRLPPYYYYFYRKTEFYLQGIMLWYNGR